MSDSAAKQCILTLNGGSSTIKYALFAAHPARARVLGATIEICRDGAGVDDALADVCRRIGARAVVGVGHRIVHGGTDLVEHQFIDERLITRLCETVPLDPSHLPGEIELIVAAQQHFRNVPHVACFDTAFHRDLPRVASLLPIPRRYTDAGVRRLGFHGLSFIYLMEQLERIGKPAEAEGRIILAHLGAGASLAAVHRRKPLDTTMAFTPSAGLVMAQRPGDLDPGLVTYLMRQEKLSPDQMDEFLTRECGLVGVSEISGNMRKLLEARASNPRAADAVDLFCYSAAKWIGALTVSLGGLDTLVFSAGIGENAPPVRHMICNRLGHLGVRLDAAANSRNDAVISSADSRVTVRVIPTDEESVIAEIVANFLKT